MLDDMTYKPEISKRALVLLSVGLSFMLFATVRPATAEPSSYILAVTWHSAFCETQAGAPECANQQEGDFSADHFVLHGLWPQPYGNFYCGVDDATKRTDLADGWADLPPLEISAALTDRLAVAMPGSASHLDRHEWVKHGTCHETPDQTVYYEQSLRLLDELNRSAVRELFASNVGERVRLRQIRAAFDNSFGAGAGERVALECETVGGRQLIVELRISLTSPVGDRPLRALMDRASMRNSACDSGIVDAPGPG
ncbi:MAG: ribonuclease [Alphaproteobacteria bacterium]